MWITICAPTKLFVNFINHVNANDEGLRILSSLSPESSTWLDTLRYNIRNHFGNNIRSVPAPIISYIGTGEKNSDMITVTIV